jgi:hypothetical protein
MSQTSSLPPAMVGGRRARRFVAIQKASAEAWARLFGIPLVTAFNS